MASGAADREMQAGCGRWSGCGRATLVYRVLAFAESLGPAPATIEFFAGAGWRRVVVPLGGIDGLDPTGAMGFLIGGPGDLGPGRLEIDNVELR